MKNRKLNIIEDLTIRKEHYSLANKLCEKIFEENKLPIQKMVIAIGGESGSGKSTTAFCLQKELTERGLNCVVLHMDSYFKLAPKDNHQNRLQSLDNVGPHEVNMSILNEHITAFKKWTNFIEVPIVNYKENSLSHKKLDLSDSQVLIVEGVYTFLLENLDQKIFIDRTYLDSHQQRIERTRENYDPYVELVLKVEHKIVAPLINKASLVVDKNYDI